MSFEIVCLLLFGGLVVLIVLGLPLVFALGGIAAVFLILFWEPSYYQAIFWDARGTLNTYYYLAIPLFIFMACMLERSGIAEDLYTVIYRWAGRVAGGLAMGTVLICTLLAAMVGLSGAAVTTMGVTALPSMMKRGYDKYIVIGCIAAGGTLGILIPPSVIMMVYAIIAGVSVADLFLGGIVPGVLLAGLFILYIGIRTGFRPQLGPPLPPEERASWGEKFTSLRHIILPVLLVVLVLGAIFFGIASVNEVAAVGAAGTIVCAAVIGRLNWKNFKEASYETLKLSVMIMWIVIAADSFSRAYVIVGAMQHVEGLFAALPFGYWGALLAIEVTFIFLGCFFDPFGILMLTAPLFVPIVESFGIEPAWFGIFFVINMEMAYLTPPVGLNLFYMKAVAPEGTSMTDIYRSVYPFVLIMLLTIVLLIIFPQIVTWLPHLVRGP
jgi:tripartite ATP-independent transporter DctM subunit